MNRVVDKFVAELEVQLADRKVFIELSDGARRWLAEKGYDRLFGARPLARVIQEHVKKPLAEEVLFGKLATAAARCASTPKARATPRKLVFTYPSARAQSAAAGQPGTGAG